MQERSRNAYIAALTEYVEGKIYHLKFLHVNQQHVNELTGRKDKPPPIIKGGSQETRKKNWVDHFMDLLGKPSPVVGELPRIKISPTLPISTEPFSLDEINLVIKSIANKILPV